MRGRTSPGRVRALWVVDDATTTLQLEHAPKEDVFGVGEQFGPREVDVTELAFRPRLAVDPRLDRVHEALERLALRGFIAPEATSMSSDESDLPASAELDEAAAAELDRES